MIIQAPEYSYNLTSDYTIFTYDLSAPVRVSDTVIYYTGYIEEYKRAFDDGLVGFIYEYDGSPHFPRVADVLYPNEMYKVTVYQDCWLGIGNKFMEM